MRGAGPLRDNDMIPKIWDCSEKGNRDGDRETGPDDLTELLSSCPKPDSLSSYSDFPVK